MTTITPPDSLVLRVNGGAGNDSYLLGTAVQNQRGWSFIPHNPSRVMAVTGARTFGDCLPRGYSLDNTSSELMLAPVRKVPIEKLFAEEEKAERMRAGEEDQNWMTIRAKARRLAK